MGTARGGRTRISFAPCSENKLATIPGEASGVELISGPRLARSPGEGRRSSSRAAGPASIHPIQDHVRTRQEDLGTPANYAWEYGRPLLASPPAAIYSWGSTCTRRVDRLSTSSPGTMIGLRGHPASWQATRTYGGPARVRVCSSPWPVSCSIVSNLFSVRRNGPHDTCMSWLTDSGRQTPS
jgi:hypothetical protein